MDKLLIYEDTGRKSMFLKEVETVKAQAEALIATFEEFQDLAEITTAGQLDLLIADPLAYYDETLRTGLNLQATGNRTPDPATLARLYAYERDNYISIINGLLVTEDCAPCKSARIIKRAGKPALKDSRWSAYRNYLTFTPAGFELNDGAIEERCETFKTFATTPGQLEVVELFNKLIEVVNRYDELFPMPGTDKEHLTRIFGLHIQNPPFMGQFLISDEHLKNAIYNK